MNTKDSRAAFYAVFDDGFRKINQPLLHSWVSYHQKWYDRKADRNRIYSHLQTILALCTPLLATLSVTYAQQEWAKLTVILVSGFIAIILGLLSFMRCGEQWIRYRTVGETLKRLTFDFLYDMSSIDQLDSAAKNKEAERCRAFVEDIDRILGNELEEWSKQRLNAILKDMNQQCSEALKKRGND